MAGFLAAVTGIVVASAAQGATACSGTGTSYAWGVAAPVCQTTRASVVLVPGVTISSITPTSTTTGSMSITVASVAKQATASDITYTWSDADDWTVTFTPPPTTPHGQLQGTITSVHGTVTQSLVITRVLIDGVTLTNLPTTLSTAGVVATSPSATFNHVTFRDITLSVTKSNKSAVGFTGTMVLRNGTQYAASGVVSQSSMNISISQTDSSGAVNRITLSESSAGYAGSAVGTVTVDDVTVTDGLLCFSTYASPTGMNPSCPAFSEAGFYASIDSLRLSSTSFTDVVLDLTLGQAYAFGFSGTMITASGSSYTIAGEATSTSTALTVEYSAGGLGARLIIIDLYESPSGFKGCFQGDDVLIGQTAFGTYEDQLVLAFSSTGNAGFPGACTYPNGVVGPRNESASTCTLSPTAVPTLMLSGAMVTDMGTFSTCMYAENGTIVQLSVSGVDMNVTSTPTSTSAINAQNSFSFDSFAFTYSNASTTGCLTFTVAVSGSGRYGNAQMAILPTGTVDGTAVTTQLTVRCGVVSSFSLALKMAHSYTNGGITTTDDIVFQLQWCDSSCAAVTYAYLNDGKPITFSKGLFGTAISQQSASHTSSTYCAGAAKTEYLTLNLAVNLQFDFGIYSTNGGSSYIATLGAGFSGSVDGTVCKLTEQLKTSFECTWQYSSGNSDTTCLAKLEYSGFANGSYTQYF